MSAPEVLAGLLRINLAGGIAILSVVALRKLARARFGARSAYGLWLLPVMAGAAALLPPRQILVVRSTLLVQSAAGPHPAVPSPSGALVSLDPFVFLGLWLVGVASAALVMGLLQHRFMRKARSGETGPAVVGVIAPRILTPRDFAQRYSPGEQALVLAHERAHIARQDSRLNGVCAAVQCLFWFNPLVHLAARLMRVDQELACDEAVVARFPSARRAYAEVLVKAQLSLLPLPLGCYWPPASEHPLVERVAMLKRRGGGGARRSGGATMLVALCAAAGFAAWAAQPADVRIVAPNQAGASAGDRTEQAAYEADVASRPRKTIVGNSPSTPTSPVITVAAKTDAPPSVHTITDAGFASDPSGQDSAPSEAKETPNEADDSGLPRPASPPSRQPDGSPAAMAQPVALQPEPATTQRAAAPPPSIKFSQKTEPADDPDQIHCKIQPVTGSRFIRRICMTGAEWKARQWRLLALERTWLLDPSGYAATEY